MDAAVQTEIETLLRERRKIEAIKLYREQHDCDLKEAKERVEAIAAELRARDPQAAATVPRAGGQAVFVVVFVLLGVVLYLALT